MALLWYKDFMIKLPLWPDLARHFHPDISVPDPNSLVMSSRDGTSGAKKSGHTSHLYYTYDPQEAEIMIDSGLGVKIHVRHSITTQ